MSDLRSFEKWCRDKIFRLHGQPIDAKLAMRLSKYVEAINAVEEYHEAIKVRSQRKAGSLPH
jgi:hypothetical protein